MKKVYLFAKYIILFLPILYGCGTSVLYFINALRDYPPEKQDDVVRWESDMESLKEIIPSDVKVIGYVSDWDRIGYDKNVYIEYALTNYSFAPQRVQRGVNFEWVIANSPADEEFLSWLSPQLMQPFTIEYFGRGIYLIHQEGK